MGEEGGQTELISSEYVCMHKYLCCALSSTKWLKRCAPWEKLHEKVAGKDVMSCTETDQPLYRVDYKSIALVK